MYQLKILGKIFNLKIFGQKYFFIRLKTFFLELKKNVDKNIQQRYSDKRLKIFQL